MFSAKFEIRNITHLFTGCEWNSLFIQAEARTTVKHVYSHHAYNEMTLITKHLGFYISLYKIYAYSEVAYNENHAYNEVILKPLGIKDHTFDMFIMNWLKNFTRFHLNVYTSKCRQQPDECCFINFVSTMVSLIV